MKNKWVYKSGSIITKELIIEKQTVTLADQEIINIISYSQAFS